VQIIFSSMANFFSPGGEVLLKRKTKIQNEFLRQSDFKDFSIING
jgi:hypothetical protein